MNQLRFISFPLGWCPHQPKLCSSPWFVSPRTNCVLFFSLVAHRLGLCPHEPIAFYFFFPLVGVSTNQNSAHRLGSCPHEPIAFYFFNSNTQTDFAGTFTVSMELSWSLYPWLVSPPTKTLLIALVRVPTNQLRFIFLIPTPKPILRALSLFQSK